MFLSWGFVFWICPSGIHRSSPCSNQWTTRSPPVYPSRMSSRSWSKCPTSPVLGLSSSTSCLLAIWISSSSDGSALLLRAWIYRRPWWCGRTFYSPAWLSRMRCYDTWASWCRGFSWWASLFRWWLLWALCCWSSGTNSISRTCAWAKRWLWTCPGFS